VIGPVLESSGEKSIFIGCGVMFPNTHSLGGEVDFFHVLFVSFERKAEALPYN
jgi:hypothetical protein